jgi:hypothetical protein
MKTLKLFEAKKREGNAEIIEFPKQEKTEIINKKRGAIGKIIQFPNISTNNPPEPNGGGGMALAA